MTRVLILQQPSSTSPVDRWLAAADPDLQIRMISGTGTKRPECDLAPGTTRTLVEDYGSAELVAAVHEQCAHWCPDRLLSNSEVDVMRAAEARALFGIPGLRPELAVQFRDKIRMKELFVAAGLPVAPAAAVQCSDDVAAFLRAEGTAVLKPRLGMGAVGVHVLESVTGLHRLLRAEPRVYDQLLNLELMAERFIPGDVFHVDATVADSLVSQFHASRYARPPHLFAERNLVSVLLDADSRPWQQLREATLGLVAALGPGSGVHVLHFELYGTPDGRYVAGEVACRLGGGLIKAAIRALTGVDMSREAYLLSAGLPAQPASLAPRGGAGFVLFTATPAPAWDSPADWLRDCFRHEEKLGHGAATSVDASGGAVVLGADAAQVLARINGLEACV